MSPVLARRIAPPTEHEHAPALRVQPRSQGMRGPVLAGVLGGFWFYWVAGRDIADPRHVLWALRGDWASHIAGWLFFRGEPWAFPLGKLNSLLHPVGSSVAFCDSIPLFALLFKPFSPWLPTDFQYFGLYLGLSFVLSAFFGALIIRDFRAPWGAQVFGGALFSLSPVVLHRLGHIALAGQWVIVAALWLGIRPARREGIWTSLAGLGALLFWSASVHPYLCAMVFVLGLGMIARIVHWEKRLSWPQAAGAVWVMAGVPIILFWLFGYLGTGVQSASRGFDAYTADLLSLINPAGWSKLLPALPMGEGQYEGVGWVGLGVVMLGLVHFIPGQETKPSTESPVVWQPLVWTCVTLAVFALGGKTTFAGFKLWSAQSLWSHVPVIPGAYRAPGRFIWPLHYLIIAGALWGSWQRLKARPHLFTAIAAAACLVTLADLPQARPFQGGPPNPILEDWRNWARGKKHLALYPARILDAGTGGCPKTFGFTADESSEILYRAYRLGLTFNSAYVSRLDDAKADAYCAELKASLGQGDLSPDTLYVVHDTAIAAVTAHLSEPAGCERVETYWLCARQSMVRAEELF